jgi:hypothetical protein
MHDDDDPLWKRIVTNELLWVVAAALLILGVAFLLATRRADAPAPRTEAR